MIQQLGRKLLCILGQNCRLFERVLFSIDKVPGTSGSNGKGGPITHAPCTGVVVLVEYIYMPRVCPLYVTNHIPTLYIEWTEKLTDNNTIGCTLAQPNSALYCRAEAVFISAML